MNVGRGNRSTQAKSAAVVTMPTINPTLPDLGSNPLHHSGKPATNRLNGTACVERFGYVAVGLVASYREGCVTDFLLSKDVLPVLN
jgi:hypothetical protein